MKENFYLLLAGGVGAAKFIDGLTRVMNPELLKIVVNTGDDIELFGLKICPDLDIITYTLARVIDHEKGWGFKKDTFNCLSILKKYYDMGWFNLGDKDLATHLYRTDLFRQGFTKVEITKKICDKLEIKTEIIPMCNESVETHVITKEGQMHFEEYYIKTKCEPEILGVEFKGIDIAKPIENVIKYINNAEKIIVCPSNPVVSIGTILSVRGIREALRKVKEKIFAISPIIEGAPVKGPADKFMKCLGFDVSCIGVAKYYQDFLGHFIIDKRDLKLKSKIEVLGIKTHVYDTIMRNLKKKIDLAKFVVKLNAN